MADEISKVCGAAVMAHILGISRIALADMAKDDSFPKITIDGNTTFYNPKEVVEHLALKEKEKVDSQLRLVEEYGRDRDAFIKKVEAAAEARKAEIAKAKEGDSSGAPKRRGRPPASAKKDEETKASENPPMAGNN